MNQIRLASFFGILGLIIALTSCLETPEISIAQQKWVPGFSKPGISLNLDQDMTFSTSINHEGGDFLRGKYQIQNGNLILSITQDTDGSYNPAKEITLAVQHDFSDIFYSESLEEQSNEPHRLKFWNQASRHPNGTVITVGELAVVVGHPKVKLTPTTQFFAQPNLESKKYLIELYEAETTESKVYTLDQSTIDSYQTVSVVGSLKADPTWLCIGMPIPEGGYDRMYLEDNSGATIQNHCWVRTQDLKFD